MREWSWSKEAGAHRVLIKCEFGKLNRRAPNTGPEVLIGTVQFSITGERHLASCTYTSPTPDEKEAEIIDCAQPESEREDQQSSIGFSPRTSSFDPCDWEKLHPVKKKIESEKVNVWASESRRMCVAFDGFLFLRRESAKWKKIRIGGGGTRGYVIRHLHRDDPVQNGRQAAWISMRIMKTCSLIWLAADIISTVT